MVTVATKKVSGLLYLVLAAIFSCGTAFADSLPADVRSALTQDDSVRLIVLLNVDKSIDRASTTEREGAIFAAGEAVLLDLSDAFTLHHRFRRVEALAVTADAATARALATHPQVRGISVDPGGFAQLDVALPLVRISPLHRFSQPPGGLRGQGMKLAVLDTGLDAGNADFLDQLVAEACFCSGDGGCCPNGSASQFGSGAAVDDHGHGTFVTGAMMSRGNNSAIGPAPEASLISVKVLDSEGRFCCASDVTAGFDWLAVNHPDLAVVNVSLGTASSFAEACDGATPWAEAMALAVEALVQNGTMVVAAAGNQANAEELIAPACLADVVSVGATWKQDFDGTFFPCEDMDPRQDEVACFSNASQALDLLAPGAMITTTDIGGGTVTLSGTSLASPIAAGCATLVRQGHPDWSVDEVRAILSSSRVLIEDPRNGLIFPRLDCLFAFDEILRDRFEPLVP